MPNFEKGPSRSVQKQEGMNVLIRTLRSAVEREAAREEVTKSIDMLARAKDRMDAAYEKLVRSMHVNTRLKGDEAIPSSMEENARADLRELLTSAQLTHRYIMEIQLQNTTPYFQRLAAEVRECIEALIAGYVAEVTTDMRTFNYEFYDILEEYDIKTG